MRANTELDPRACIALGLVRAALHLHERLVGAARVPTEVLLDRDELRREQPFAGQDERLHDPRDPAVAVAERVDGDDMEVCQRRADDRVSVGVAVVQPVDDLADGRWHVLVRRADVGGRPPSGFVTSIPPRRCWPGSLSFWK
jgi:hypothetical protein